MLVVIWAMFEGELMYVYSGQIVSCKPFYPPNIKPNVSILTKFGLMDLEVGPTLAPHKGLTPWITQKLHDHDHAMKSPWSSRIGQVPEL